jgi:hypothetical protein
MQGVDYFFPPIGFHLELREFYKFELSGDWRCLASHFCRSFDGKTFHSRRKTGSPPRLSDESVGRERGQDGGNAQFSQSKQTAEPFNFRLGHGR